MSQTLDTKILESMNSPRYRRLVQSQSQTLVSYFTNPTKATTLIKKLFVVICQKSIAIHIHFNKSVIVTCIFVLQMINLSI